MKGSFYKLIIMIVCMATFVVMGYFFLFKNNKDSLSTRDVGIPAVQDKQLNNALPGWKEYLSRNYRYSIRIPSSSSIFDEKINYLPFTGTTNYVLLGENFNEYGDINTNKKNEILGYTVRLFIESNNELLPVKEFIERKLSQRTDNTSVPIISKEEILVSGYHAYLIDFDNGRLERDVSLGYGDIVYTFTFAVDVPRKNRLPFDPNLDAHNKIFENILLNFRFLDRITRKVIVPPAENQITYPRLPSFM